MTNRNSARAGVMVLAAVVAIAAGIRPAEAHDYVVEAEIYYKYGSYDLGGAPIGNTYCASASGRSAVEGLDVPGEWIMLLVDFPTAFCYKPYVDFQAVYGDTVEFRVTILEGGPSGEDLESDFIGVGAGIG